MNFGDKVRYIREKFSLTTTQLAKLLNVTQSYVSHVENNRRQFGRDKIVVLAKELQIPVEFFLREDVDTLEQIRVSDGLEALFNDERYPNYFGVVDYAVKAGIRPEELEQAIEFIKNIRHKTR
ncbi:helix-turn-helix domain-containing protein [Sporomusa malonica]|uniref:Helix-turn-helix domain-containing protein n=1 Tax=Sporomusa malonica TaxID=112901 RepID=A0A1W1Y7B7_9FIRM|nr:helix-turn-helix transcriptional regulator [Sporomusa malonica]SMC32046.1 Helix-turn-helix domain-containing protein [Sporomusa malonica]